MPPGYPLFPDRVSPQTVYGYDIGVRIEGNPYTERANVLGEEADLVYVDAFFPNGKGGLGGKVKILVDAVPVGGKTTIIVGTQRRSDPSATDRTGSPYGHYAIGPSGPKDLDDKINFLRQPGNTARLTFAIAIQGPDIEPETYDNGTSNLMVRYAQHLLKDAKLRNDIQQFANGYTYFGPGRNSTMEVPEDLVIPAIRFIMTTKTGG
jgi:hypothetical protein